MMKKIALIFTLCLLIISCTKTEVVIIEIDELPNYSEVPTLKIQHYVNRIYIDILGREPFVEELEHEVAYLKLNDLAIDARKTLILKLQTDTNFIANDSSYTKRYHYWFYQQAKTRLIEGATVDEIDRRGIYESGINILEIQFLEQIQNGEVPDSTNWYRLHAEIAKINRVLDAEGEYAKDIIPVNEVMRRLCHNWVYDEINMNTFNFINATFDNLFFRFPNTEEFDIAYAMMENDELVDFWGKPGKNKSDYLNIITKSQEFYEGMIIWAYQLFLARNPTSEETAKLLEDFIATSDYRAAQRDILSLDEYANF